MGKERIIDREVKRTQSLYELKEKTINQQGSYNLSLEAMERLVNLNIIKKLTMIYLLNIKCLMIIKWC